MNNGEVELQRNEANGESFCYTAVNPFHVKLLKHDKKRKGVQLQMSKKIVKSPTRKASMEGDKNKIVREKSPTRVEVQMSRKRVKSPTKKGEKNKSVREKSPTIISSSRKHGSTGLRSPPTNCKFSVKIGKVSGMKFSPEAKRRRGRSQYVEPTES